MFIGLSQSATSRLMDRMESKSCGVIKRQGYGKDKRDIYAVLTDKGEQLFKEANETFESTLKTSFKNHGVNPNSFFKR